jgi:hypothetical protein
MPSLDQLPGHGHSHDPEPQKSKSCHPSSEFEF